MSLYIQIFDKTKVSFLVSPDTSQKFGFSYFGIKTNFTIGGFVTGQPRSPLIICLSLSGPQVHQDPYQPTY